MKTKIRRRCKCGCGKITNYGKVWVSGHNPPWNKNRRGTGKTKIRRRCKCGCGEITNHGRRYIHGHTWKGKKLPKETCLKNSISSIKYDPNAPYCDIWKDDEYRRDLRKDYCENKDCKRNCKRLHNHHIDLDKKNCHPKNVMTLCVSCHVSLHRRLSPQKNDVSQDFLIINRLDHVSYINKKTRKKIIIRRVE